MLIMFKKSVTVISEFGMRPEGEERSNYRTDA